MSVQRAIILTRISDDRPDDAGIVSGRGVADQEQDGRALADRLGWPVWRVVVENATSAFKRRKILLPDGTRALRVVRPGFRSVLDDLAAGRADALIALDLDRAVRDPRDLEDLIDVVEERRIPVESVTGSLRLANDADITMARVMVAVANKASRDTGRRVSRARLRAAEEGRYGGGKRPFGFEADGVTIRPSEAREIVAACSAVLEGIPVREITLGLRRRGVPTVQGGSWTTASLRTILCRPRNAGLMVHRGARLDMHPACWEPLVSPEVFESVTRILGDPDRITSPGNSPAWLGSGIYRCSCSGPVRVHGQGRYRCTWVVVGERSGPGHSTIAARPTDQAVEAALLERLALPETVEMFAPPAPSVDLGALRSEASALRVRLTALAEDFADGDLTRSQLAAGTKRAQTRLNEIDGILATAMARSPLAPFAAGMRDVEETWSDLPLATQRAIVALLMRVDIRRATPGLRAFDRGRIAITWKRPGE